MTVDFFVLASEKVDCCIVFYKELYDAIPLYNILPAFTNTAEHQRFFKIQSTFPHHRACVASVSFEI
jgi:hypothetical protein